MSFHLSNTDQIIQRDVKYIRVGVKYFRYSTMLYDDGHQLEVIDPWNKTTVKDDFGKDYSLPADCKYIGFSNTNRNEDLGWFSLVGFEKSSEKVLGRKTKVTVYRRWTKT